MSNPIKQLLLTPLSMQYISDINSLSKLPLPLYKFFIDCGLALNQSGINSKDRQLLAKILTFELVPSQLISGSIDSVDLIQDLSKKVFKLMRTSEPQQVEANLINCQKYIFNVLIQNTMIGQNKLNYLLEKLSESVHQNLENAENITETKLGTIQWSIYNLKKSSLVSKLFTSQSNKQKQMNINKIYVKLSFDQNFPQSQIDKLIQSHFKSNIDKIIEAKIQSNINQQKIKPKTIVMSLIDFKLFMEEIEKIKNFNS